ncbi:DEAD/DEAH box helicase [Ligilactobacillus pabuli]|uniref:DEAD/DEAH box helicase n=1 Tax=Ligilactobacillus pabuli TaxID=2886039 RepID=A0ABQ5JFB2_9LACO|nr:DEAD/DEAH box helicase [Ligilactobacillus pabuli]GKS80705.1 DEAD/DEAH box helicase [Ligilactobacillus pabuli]
MAEIAKSATDKGNRVLFVVHRRELVEQIKQTFTKWGVDMSLCQVGMVQTITRRLQKIPIPKMILVDECHHSIAKTYQRIFDKFPNANVIGFTATPQRLGKKQLDVVYNDLVLGPKIKWLVQNNFLAPYKYYSVNMIDTTELKRSSTGDYTVQSMGNAAKSIIYGDVVKHYQKFADHTKTIVYTYNVASSKKVADKFLAAGYSAKQVDGETPKDVRQKAMDDFRTGKVTILVNAELYGEGIDVPDCETVIMLRPTESLSLFIQTTMRAMRYKPNKTAKIIDMVANWKTHNLPDADREWSLESKPKKNTEAMDIVQCENCLGVSERSDCGKGCIIRTHKVGMLCPLCGELLSNGRESNGPIHEDAELKEITPGIVLNFKSANKGDYWQKLKEAKTWDDLEKIRKERGYKPGWVWYQAKQKNITK